MGMGELVYGSNGKNAYVFKTQADLSQAFKFSPKNDSEKNTFSQFYKQISNETLYYTFTRKLITRFK